MKLATPTLVVLFAAAPAAAQEGDGELADMSLEELMEVPITTASNVEEKLGDAPAVVVVLSREELEDRGYLQLGDVFDDLPGIDVTRPYGDNWLLVYWRGWRADVSAPFLLLVDGMPTNSLYFGDVDVPLTSLPLTMIDRVEVVSGPASSVYGANAFMGVLNVITVDDAAEDGLTQRARLGLGSEGARVTDATLLFKKDVFRVRLSARFETGLFDDEHADAYEYTRDEYFADRRLWGGFVDNPAIAGAFRSRHDARAVAARIFYDDSELGLSWMTFSSGYGVEYAGDRAQNDSVWKRRELDVWARHRAPLGARVESRTMLRYRESGIPGESFFVDGYEDAARGHVAAFSYWQSHNYSASFAQDFVLTRPIAGFSGSAGLELEQKDLQKAYDIHGESAPGTPGGYEHVDDITADGYLYPEPPVPVREAGNRIETEDFGAYVQAKWAASKDHHVHLGGRVDGSSGYATTPTLRAGYVGRFPAGRVGAFGAKALFGQAFQEPAPRVLYGGWTGSGSDPELAPERSRTVEIAGSHTHPRVRSEVDLWFVENEDTILVGAVPENVGRRSVIGLDLSTRAQLPVPRMRRVELWASWTHLFRAEEAQSGDGGVSTVYRIGDLADDKAHFGVWAQHDGHLGGSIRGRWVGGRPTVISNPIGWVDGYTTIDVHVRYLDLAGTGLGLALTVDNLTNARYLHPGINDANAGVDPGTFAADGSYTGSRGFFSSALPQPGRTFMLTLSVEP